MIGAAEGDEEMCAAEGLELIGAVEGVLPEGKIDGEGDTDALLGLDAG